MEEKEKQMLENIALKQQRIDELKRAIEEDPLNKIARSRVSLQNKLNDSSIDKKSKQFQNYYIGKLQKEKRLFKLVGSQEEVIKLIDEKVKLENELTIIKRQLFELQAPKLF